MNEFYYHQYDLMNKLHVYQFNLYQNCLLLPMHSWLLLTQMCLTPLSTLIIHVFNCTCKSFKWHRPFPATQEGDQEGVSSLVLDRVILQETAWYAHMVSWYRTHNVTISICGGSIYTTWILLVLLTLKWSWNTVLIY